MPGSPRAGSPFGSTSVKRAGCSWSSPAGATGKPSQTGSSCRRVPSTKSSARHALLRQEARALASVSRGGSTATANAGTSWPSSSSAPLTGWAWIGQVSLQWCRGTSRSPASREPRIDTGSPSWSAQREVGRPEALRHDRALEAAAAAHGLLVARAARGQHGGRRARTRPPGRARSARGGSRGRRVVRKHPARPDAQRGGSQSASSYRSISTSRPHSARGSRRTRSKPAAR